MKRKETYYITITSGMRGYLAVMIAVDDTGFSEPVQTSPFSFNSYDKAKRDAEEWARAENLPCK